MEVGRAWEGRMCPWLGEQERYRYTSPSGEVIRKREIPTCSSGEVSGNREIRGGTGDFIGLVTSQALRHKVTNRSLVVIFQEYIKVLG